MSRVFALHTAQHVLVCYNSGRGLLSAGTLADLGVTQCASHAVVTGFTCLSMCIPLPNALRVLLQQLQGVDIQDSLSLHECHAACAVVGSNARDGGLAMCRQELARGGEACHLSHSRHGGSTRTHPMTAHGLPAEPGASKSVHRGCRSRARRTATCRHSAHS